MTCKWLITVVSKCLITMVSRVSLVINGGSNPLNLPLILSGDPILQVGTAKDLKIPLINFGGTPRKINMENENTGPLEEENHLLETIISRFYINLRGVYLSGQIIATSHDRFPPNGGLVREIPLFQGNLGW